ncbi:MAG: AraC family transcriptional regulator [Verrucomicrobiota bacterium]
MKSNDGYVPHLLLSKGVVPAGGEWVPRGGGWRLLHVTKGHGYWVHRDGHIVHSNGILECPSGSVLVVSPHAMGYLLASQLGALEVDYFVLHPERLAGVMDLQELQFLSSLARESLKVSVLPENHGVAGRFREVSDPRRSGGFLDRLEMLQIVAEVFSSQWPGKTGVGEISDARERLRQVLDRTLPAELVGLSSSELAQRAGCTVRHFTRLFQELMGMSLSDKRTELRLSHATELLASSDSKILDIAMESGYQSLSLFNLHFKRSYGVNPTRWRDQLRARKLRSKGKICDCV